jgi:hypothetical protein
MIKGIGIRVSEPVAICAAHSQEIRPRQPCVFICYCFAQIQKYFCSEVAVLQPATINHGSIELTRFIVRLPISASTENLPVDHGFQLDFG